MGIQDRDYLRDRRLRSDEAPGNARPGGNDGEPPHRGPPWWTWLIVAAVFFGLGAFAWVQRNEETQRPARHGPLPDDVLAAVNQHHAGESVPMLVGKIMRVVDGDTIAVRLGSGPIEVRLHAIDAPEYDQPGGPEASEALKQHLRRRTEVALQPVDQDSYERLVADVYLGDELVNEWLVKEGYAWAYRRYADDPAVCEWEGEARAAHRGVWSTGHPMAPWDWRMKQHQRGYQPKDYSNVTVESCMADIKRDRRGTVAKPRA